MHASTSLLTLSFTPLRKGQIPAAQELTTCDIRDANPLSEAHAAARKSSYMTFTHPHQRNDWMALEMARLVARRLRGNPALVELGRERILSLRERGRDFVAYREWEELIKTLTVAEIADILEAETDEGQRLRSSRPFIGPSIITAEERQSIIDAAFAD